jgi:hypothetical protein
VGAEIEILVWEDAAGGVEYYLDITDRQNVSRRAAVALRSGENRQTQKRSNNDKEWSIHVNPPSFLDDH